MKYQSRPHYVSVLSNCNDFDNGDDFGNDDEEIVMVIENESDLEESTVDIEHLKLQPMQEKKCRCFDCILKYIAACDARKKKFENIFKLYKYIAMLPCTQVKCERDFSKLKLTKTRLRSSLTEKSLENLMLISLGSNMFKNINLDDIIDDIIANSSRLSLFMGS